MTRAFTLKEPKLLIASAVLFLASAAAEHYWDLFEPAVGIGMAMFLGAAAFSHVRNGKLFRYEFPPPTWRQGIIAAFGFALMNGAFIAKGADILITKWR